MKQARAHRIGQTQEVQVYRFVSKSTVEEVILRRAFRKLSLKYQVLDKGDFSAGSKSLGSVLDDEEDLEAETLAGIIKFGLQELIIDDNSTIVDDDIDTILARAKVYLLILCSLKSHLS